VSCSLLYCRGWVAASTVHYILMAAYTSIFLVSVFNAKQYTISRILLQSMQYFNEGKTSQFQSSFPASLYFIYLETLGKTPCNNLLLQPHQIFTNIQSPKAKKIKQKTYYIRVLIHSDARGMCCIFTLCLSRWYHV
jgi:predicted nucleotidyltransferase